MFDLAKPSFLLRVIDFFWPVFWLVMLGGLGWGLYEGLFVSPQDYQQGDAVRIMYVHVPSAWLALGCYVFMSVCAVITLVFKHPLADAMAQAAAPVGAAFAFLVLITGAIWGKPMWGTWWVWDARLTSMLILFLMYVGLLLLRNALAFKPNGAKLIAILILVGFVNIPIIKFSVDWWSTLHQGASVLRLDGPKIHPDMLRPLLISAFGFCGLFALLVATGLKNILMMRRLRTKSLRQISGEKS